MSETVLKLISVIIIGQFKYVDYLPVWIIVIITLFCVHSFLHTTMILGYARTENKQLQEKFNALENQSMGDNLIFTEQSGEKDNDCSRKCYDLLRYLYKTITS